MSIAPQDTATRAAAKPWQMHSQNFDITADMLFEKAAELWLSSRVAGARENRRLVRYVRVNTEKAYHRQIKSLRLFFEGMQLGDIRLDVIRRYQMARVAGDEPFVRYRKPQDAKPRIVDGVTLAPKGKTPCPAKPAQVNQEITMLIRILKSAHLWTEETADRYQPLLEEESGVPRALRPDEQEHWLATSQSHPRWHLVYWYSLLAFDTCMSTNELRSLRLGDIDLRSRIVTIPPEGAKTRARLRTIPIATSEAFWALEQLLQRAHDLGSREHFHYLFPFRDHCFKWYPDRPAAMQFLKRSWEEVRLASGLTWFRPYDTRHTAVTRLAEAGTPLAVIMKRAGHISPRMTDHYTHISDQRQIQAVQSAQRMMGGGLVQRQTWKPAERPGVDFLMHPAVQAEIARQVELALHQGHSIPTEETAHV